MGFAPQQRALFRHLDVKKWSEHVVFLPFWLGIVLRATTVCTFSTSLSTSKSGPNPLVSLPFWLGNVLRATTACTFSTSQLFTFFTYKCASRHNGVQFLISHVATWLHTRRFSEVTFRPSGAPNHWKNIVNRDFPTFSRTCIFSLLTFSISYLLTSWLLRPDSSHLCFSVSAYCAGSLASKFPSMIYMYTIINYVFYLLIYVQMYGSPGKSQCLRRIWGWFWGQKRRLPLSFRSHGRTKILDGQAECPGRFGWDPGCNPSEEPCIPHYIYSDVWNPVSKRAENGNHRYHGMMNSPSIFFQTRLAGKSLNQNGNSWYGKIFGRFP